MRNLCRCLLVSSAAVPTGSGTGLRRNATSAQSRSGFFRPGIPVAATLAKIAEISGGRVRYGRQAGSREVRLRRVHLVFLERTPSVLAER